MEKEDHIKLLKLFIPSIQERKTDRFFEFLHLIEKQKHSNGEGLKKDIIRLADKISKDDVGDFKYLIKEFFKTLDMTEKVLQHFKVPIFSYLLSKNLLDENKLDDPIYLRLAAANYVPGDFYDSVKVIIKYDQDFIEIAEHSFSVKKPLVAIVLFAVSIEHKINNFYRDVLICKSLNDGEVTQAIRTLNMHDKLGWFISLSLNIKIESNLKNSILGLFDFRNAIVHYKHIPELFDEPGIRDNWESNINKFNINKLKAMVAELEQFFDTARKQEIPNYEEAIKLSDRAFKARPNLQELYFDL